MSVAVPIKVYIAAARSPPRSERANSHALPPRAIQRGLSGRDIHVPPFGVAGPALDRQRRDHHRPRASRGATDAMGRSSAGKNPQSRSAELTDERGPRFVDLLMVSAIFRLTLERADHTRDAVIAAGHYRGIGGFLWVCGGAAAAVALAAWLVRRFSPYASGSGIPHVEAAASPGPV